MPTSTTAPLVTAAGALWARLRREHEAVPPVQIVITPGRVSADHGPSRWKETDGVVQGLTVGAATVHEGATAVAQALLHEAAHLLAWRRGVQDTSARGRYHNGAFLAAAEEVGLVRQDRAPQGREAPGRGFTAVLSEEAAALYSQEIAAIAATISDVLPALVVPRTPPYDKDSRRQLVCRCADPRRIRASQRVVALGPIICGVCGEDFRVD